MADDEAIEAILAGHSATVIELVGRLRELVKETAPELVEEPKKGWGNITYSKKGVVCAISPHKVHVNLHFYKGASLPDPSGLLEGSGKALRHVKVVQSEDIQRGEIAQLVREAVQLDGA
jgi:hypothetical protein